MTRSLRLVATLLVTGLCVAYLLWKIDVGKTLHILTAASPAWIVLAVFLFLVTVPPMSWRWQLLLRARGVRDSLGWLTRAYFVSYAAGQVLPTSLGGDASRIYETTRRHPGNGAAITGSILLERAIGGAVTLFLAAVGLALAVGHYDVGVYLWIEAAFVVAMVVAAIVFFSRSVRRLLRFGVPLLRRLRLERPARIVYEGIHGYRAHTGTMLTVSGATLLIQIARVLAIWAAAEAVGVGLSPRPYFALGPLLFLVMLVPFTVNGFAVREAFFVSFLGKLDVGPDAAFATGFLFFLLTLVLALPGLAIFVWEGVRRPVPVPDG